MPKIFIASMNLRGMRAPSPKSGNMVKINVTSAQATKNIDRISFSPMSAVEGGYKGFYCFENYWQSGKVIEGMDHTTSLKWWKSQMEPKRRYPNSKGKKVLYSLDEKGGKRDYIQSRKEVYVPEYFTLCCRGKRIKELQEFFQQGRDIVIYDFDGPRAQDGTPICQEVTLDLLKEKINDPTFPFGHGYVVAATISGIPISDFM